MSVSVVSICPVQYVNVFITSFDVSYRALESLGMPKMSGLPTMLWRKMNLGPSYPASAPKYPQAQIKDHNVSENTFLSGINPHRNSPEFRNIVFPVSDSAI